MCETTCSDSKDKSRVRQSNRQVTTSAIDEDNFKSEYKEEKRR
jgi:hypothetical protein